MKLLFDENLSPSLVLLLTELFPASSHVADVGLKSAADSEVWDYAKKNDYTIVSQDSDFNDFSILYGHPPKVIWLRVGNAQTERMASLLKKRFGAVQSFVDDLESGCLVLS